MRECSNCRIAGLLVGGGDTAQGGLPRLVSPPTGETQHEKDQLSSLKNN